jgi:hypothetical protein
MYITLTQVPDSKPGQAGTDLIVIGSLKVEHIGFSAFVQTRFSDKGLPTDEQREPAGQPPLVVNGSLVEK